MKKKENLKKNENLKKFLLERHYSYVMSQRSYLYGEKEYYFVFVTQDWVKIYTKSPKSSNLTFLGDFELGEFERFLEETFKDFELKEVKKIISMDIR